MKKLAALCLALLLLLNLPGCPPNRYKLTVDDRDGLLYEQPDQKYYADDQVVIKTHILFDADIQCYVNGKSIGKQTAVKTGDEYTHWEYYFEMPAEDVTVTFEIVGGKPY